jgi:hypothetical protein
MTVTSTIVPLLVFEAADCLMAIPASEIGHLEKRGRVQFSEEAGENCTRPLFGEPHFDLGMYFNGRDSDGPWLHWGRGTRSAWLRVHNVVDVVPIAVSGLSRMPSLLRGDRRTRAFLAAGVRGDDVFLLLDPARLSVEPLKATLDHPSAGRDKKSVGRDFSRAGNE